MYTRWIAGLRPASLLGLRLPKQLGVFATDTVSQLTVKFLETKVNLKNANISKLLMESQIQREISKSIGDRNANMSKLLIDSQILRDKCYYRFYIQDTYPGHIERQLYYWTYGKTFIQVQFWTYGKTFIQIQFWTYGKTLFWTYGKTQSLILKNMFLLVTIFSKQFFKHFFRQFFA